MKIGVNISIDVTKLDKSKFFKGKKGTYADLTVFIDENESEHGNNGLVKQKADRGVEMPILGNAKIFWSDSSQPQVHPNQTGTVPNAPIDLDAFDPDMPF